jgi:ribose/xylose/arabinose/galactoside ABC-type transport system permease subunit
MSDRKPMRMWWLLLAVAAIPAVGEIFGHPYFSSLGNGLEHHAFHAATVVLAAGVFWSMMAHDIKRNGVPPRLQRFERMYRSLRGGQKASA